VRVGDRVRLSARVTPPETPVSAVQADRRRGLPRPALAARPAVLVQPATCTGVHRARSSPTRRSCRPRWWTPPRSRHRRGGQAQRWAHDRVRGTTAPHRSQGQALATRIGQLRRIFGNDGQLTNTDFTSGPPSPPCSTAGAGPTWCAAGCCRPWCRSRWPGYSSGWRGGHRRGVLGPASPQELTILYGVVPGLLNQGGHRALRTRHRRGRRLVRGWALVGGRVPARYCPRTRYRSRSSPAGRSRSPLRARRRGRRRRARSLADQIGPLRPLVRPAAVGAGADRRRAGHWQAMAVRPPARPRRRSARWRAPARLLVAPILAIAGAALLAGRLGAVNCGPAVPVTVDPAGLAADRARCHDHGSTGRRDHGTDRDGDLRRVGDRSSAPRTARRAPSWVPTWWPRCAPTNSCRRCRPRSLATAPVLHRPPDHR
jgi:hypothetical protein